MAAECGQSPSDIAASRKRAQDDQIIQIGATRVVAGKLRRQECFEHLVVPQRSVPAAEVGIHGIELLIRRGQPIIDAELLAFHR